MKKILLVICVCLSTTLSAQFVKNHAVYLSGGVVLGKPSGISGALNYILKEKFSMEMGWTGLWRKSEFHPDDYSGGVENLLSLGLSAPRSKVWAVEFLVGKIQKLNNEGTIRMNWKVGVAGIVKEEPRNWEKKNWSLWDGNYAFDFRRSNRVGFIVKPELEFPFTFIVGYSIAPYLMYDTEELYYGVQVKMMKGLLRSPK